MSRGVAVFKNAHVFDGTRFLPGFTDVVFDGGIITAVGPGCWSQNYPDAELIDCSRKTILPGLIDLHVHLATSNPGSIYAFSEPFSLQFYESVRNLEVTLRAGITTAHDAGGTDLGAKTAVETGLIKGPRLRVAINIMSQTGGHGNFWQPSGLSSPTLGPHPGRPCGVADGVEEVRKAARSLLRAGAGQIKMCTTGGVLSPADDPRNSQFTAWEIAVIVEEAESQGKYVMAHAQEIAGIVNALRAGVRTIEHGMYLAGEAIQMFLNSNAYLVPTLAAPQAVIRKAEAGGGGLSPQVLDKARRVVEVHRQSISKAVDVGVKIGMGTDSGSRRKISKNSLCWQRWA